MTTTIGTAPTDPDEDRPPTPEAGPARRPALRFVAGVAVLIALLAGLRWTGAASPRASLVTGVPSAADLTYDAATGWGWVAFDVRNDGALPIRVDAIDVPPRPGVDDLRVLQRDEDDPTEGRAYPGVPGALADVTSLAPFDGFELPGHSRREIVILVHVTCQRTWPDDIIESAFDPRARLRVTTRSVSGLTARVGFGGVPRDDGPHPDGC